MEKKKLLMTFAAVLLSLSGWGATGDTFTALTEEGVEMKFKVINEDEKTCEVSAPAIDKATKGLVTIPAETSGYSVIRISNEAFKGCTALTSVKIPESVKYIYASAFFLCSALQSVELQEGLLSIGYQVFANCTSLRSINIPASVTTIGSQPLIRCSSLTNIVVDAANTKYDSRDNCNAIINTSTGEVLAACKTSQLPKGIKKLSESLFAGLTDLVSIVLPEGLETLGAYTFSGCTNLESITFPSTMKAYGIYTLNGVASMRQIILHATTPPVDNFKQFFYGVPDDFDINNFTWYVPKGKRELYVRSLPWISSNKKCIIETGEDEDIITFADEEVRRLCTAKYDANFSGELDQTEAAGVLTIDKPIFCQETFKSNTKIKDFNEFRYFTGLEKIESAFDGCTALTTITLPQQLKEISYSAFRGCTSLQTINIPAAVTTINNFAFDQCTSLSTIVIPMNVNKIGLYAFPQSEALTSVYVVNPEPFSIDGYAFPWRFYHTLYVPKGSKAAYESAVYWKDFKAIEEVDFKCATPTISYHDGKLHFDCETEDVVFNYTITMPDTESGSGNDIALSTVYTVHVYASKDGYSDSETATMNIDVRGLKGDVNADGKVTITDAVSVVNIILDGKQE